MNRVRGWWLWLSAFLGSRAHLACLVRDHAAARLALKRQVLALQAELVVTQATLAGQKGEAERMANVTATALDELHRIRIQLGKQSMNKQEEVAP